MRSTSIILTYIAPLLMYLAAPGVAAAAERGTLKIDFSRPKGLFLQAGNITLLEYEWPCGLTVNGAYVTYTSSDRDSEESGSGYGIAFLERGYFSSKHVWLYVERGVSYWDIRGERSEKIPAFSGPSSIPTSTSTIRSSPAIGE